MSAEIFNSFHQYMTTWYGKLFLAGFIFSLFYHLSNGVRHLFWDAGLGLEISTTYKSGYLTVFVSITLTIVMLFLGGVV
tara:strand:- start:2003 stop:2239 length:237 start_codon:yes stop_codon:yes gene_type:complete